MTNSLNLSGPTVTLFGDRDVLDDALSDELGRRGCSTHAVSIPVGWLHTASHVVVRLDTVAGERAMRDLVASADAPATHVVAVCETTDDATVSDRLSELCRQCGEQHDVSLIWIPPYDLGAHPDGGRGEAADSRALASTIADEVGHQEAWTTAPSFATQVYEPGRHRGRS